jgi:hypothetical protein
MRSATSGFFRRLEFVKEQVLMTAAAQNIKRMGNLLLRRGKNNLSSLNLSSHLSSSLGSEI